MLTLKISLDGTKPAVWRTIHVREDLPLTQLHDRIQGAMGWNDSHLHLFKFGGTAYVDHRIWDDHGGMASRRGTRRWEGADTSSSIPTCSNAYSQSASLADDDAEINARPRYFVAIDRNSTFLITMMIRSAHGWRILSAGIFPGLNVADLANSSQGEHTNLGRC